jgi:hypothetical protein
MRHRQSHHHLGQKSNAFNRPSGSCWHVVRLAACFGLVAGIVASSPAVLARTGARTKVHIPEVALSQAGVAQSCYPENNVFDTFTTYQYTGHPESVTIPARVRCLYIVAWGASGGAETGGLGGGEQAYFPTKPGEKLSVIVGYPGSSAAITAADGGYGGGGDSGSSGLNGAWGSGGGGGSFVYGPSGSLLIAAGGGGGDSAWCADTKPGSTCPVAGGPGSGGGLSGLAGNRTPSGPSGGGGGGAGQASPGTGGSAGGNTGATAGQTGTASASGVGNFGMGGAGGAGAPGAVDVTTGGQGGGGGGGGYVGGGGGGGGGSMTSGAQGSGGEGGGGSGYVSSAGKDITSNTGVNGGYGSVTITTWLPTPPQVEKVVPDDGSIDGGQTIKVDGLAFTGATGVSFELPDGTEVPAKSFSCDPTICSVVTPNVSKDVASATAGASAEGQRRDGAPRDQVPTNVRVTTKNGTSVINAFDKYIFSRLTVTSVSPRKGPIDGPEKITVSGLGFEGATKLGFFGTEWADTQHPPALGPSQFQVLDKGTRITFTAPKNIDSFLPKKSTAAAYPTDIVVQVGSNESPKNPNDSYSFEAPRVASVSVNHAAVDVNIPPLVLRGANFDAATDMDFSCGGTSHHFGWSKGNGFSVRSPTKISSVELSTTNTDHKTLDAQIAQWAGQCGFSTDDAAYRFDVRVLAGHAWSPVTNSDSFDFDGPVITGPLDPDKGFLDAGSPFAIHGTGFQQATEVRLASQGGDSALAFDQKWFSVHENGTVLGLSTRSDMHHFVGPPNASGNFPVRLTVAVGKLSSPNSSVEYTFVGPQITRVNPDSGPVDGGNRIAISGKGFIGATQVLFSLKSKPSIQFHLAAGKFHVSDGGDLVTVPNMPPASIVLPPDREHAKNLFNVQVLLGNVKSPMNPDDEYTTKP